jgi:hypothetical protein
VRSHRLKNQSISTKSTQKEQKHLFFLEKEKINMATIQNTSIPPSSADLIPAHLDICNELPPYRAIESSSVLSLRPYNNCTHSGPYNWKLAKDELNYTQTSFLKITGKMRIVLDTNGQMDVIPADAEVAPLDFFGQAWIKKVEVSINNEVKYEGAEYNYHTKVLTNTLLNYDVNATACHLQAAGFPEEEQSIPGEGDANLAEDVRRPDWEGLTWDSLKANKEKFSRSKYVEFSTDLQIGRLK